MKGVQEYLKEIQLIFTCVWMTFKYCDISMVNDSISYRNIFTQIAVVCGFGFWKWKLNISIIETGMVVDLNCNCWHFAFNFQWKIQVKQRMLKYINKF